MEAGISRREIETHLIEKCWKDPSFQKQIISDPKGMFEKYTGQKLPEKLKIFIHPEDANTVHFSIPPVPANLNELSDEDLERVAGGTDVVMTTILTAIGALGGSLLSVGLITGADAGKRAGW